MWFLVTVPIFFSGYFNKNAVFPLCIVAITLGFYLLARGKIPLPDTWTNRLLGSIGIISIILLPFSLLIIHSIPGVLWWIAIFGVFAYSQVIITDKSALIRLSYALVASSLVFALQSTYYFIIIGLSSYTRLNSMIGLHNVYGGYLILPFFITLAFVFMAKTKTKQILWAIASSFLLSNIILTFSRGLWVSAILAIIIVCLAFNRQIRLFLSQNRIFQKKTFETAIIIVGITLISGLFTARIWSIAKYVTVKQNVAETIISTSSPLVKTASSNKDFGIFTGENASDNAFTARITYFKDALNVSLGSLLVGFGPGNYADALAHWKTDPIFYSSDPHNFYLKLLAEQGIFVFAIFITFLVFLFWIIYRLSSKLKENIPFLYIAIFTGLIASIIHIGMEVDWNTPALMLIFFIFAGAFYSIVNNSNNSIPPNNSVSKQDLPYWLTTCLFIVLTIASIITLWLFLANNTRLDGDYHYEKAKYSKALDAYSSAISKNPYEPDSWFGRSKVYFALKQYKDAKNDIDQAVKLYSTFGDYYFARAKLDSAIGDKKMIESDLLNSIKYRPSNDLSDYLNLVILYVSQGKKDEIKKLISNIVPIYKKYQTTLWFKSDPNSQVIDMNLALLEGLGQIK